ncbi:MAG: CDP-diacylglycerol--serine O-phosphatidyltransferase, partial [Gallionellaceae bacterium]
GAEYDSLSDMVSFGVAPSLIVYGWALGGLGKWGWFAAFIYCAAAALRLARFNTNIEIIDKNYFQGLPSPAAAALLASFVWVMLDNNFAGADVRWYACGLTVYAGLSMVSNLKYYSFKSINMRKSVPFIVIFLIALFFILVSVDPPIILFTLFSAYSLSGFVTLLLDWKKSHKAKVIEPEK